jgi:hypothetical protein
VSDASKGPAQALEEAQRPIIVAGRSFRRIQAFGCLVPLLGVICYATYTLAPLVRGVSLEEFLTTLVVAWWIDVALLWLSLRTPAGIALLATLDCASDSRPSRPT